MAKGEDRNKMDNTVHNPVDRRCFLVTTALAIATLTLNPLSQAGTVAATPHRYKLAPEAPDDVREAYRFALANRSTLRYIACYCGCGEQGHTSNASCYFKDDSTPEKPVFDRMSLG
jgi:hypothetical protein